MLAKVGEINWPTVGQVLDSIANAGREGAEVAVVRGGQQLSLGMIVPEGGVIGIGLQRDAGSPIVGQVEPDSPFASADLPRGSTLLTIDQQPVKTWADLQRILAQLTPDESSDTVTARVEARLHLGDQPVETFEVQLTAQQIDQVRNAGWVPAMQVGLDDLMVEIKADGPIDAAAIGTVKTKEFIQQTYITLLRLFQGSVGVKNLRGPVGIVDEGSRIASRGTAYYLFFLGLISVNLAVLNFLPIPIVDGGLMVFLLIEKLKGSPASPKVQIAVSLIGLVGLACIFLYVTYNDISRLITG